VLQSSTDHLTPTSPQQTGGLARAARLVCAGLLVCLAAIGCQNDLEGLRGVERAGIDPPKDELFFPTGLIVSPEGRFLFVTNGNSDLEYNGGTVAAVNLAAVSRRLATGAGLGCRWAAQDRDVLECDETGLIIDEATVRIGNFGADLALLERQPWLPEVEPDGVGKYRLYIPVRGDPSVTYVDVIFDSEEESSSLRCLSCGEQCAPVGDDLPGCRNDHVVMGPPEDAPYIGVGLPEEPYGIFVDEALRLLYVSHLTGGGVSLLDLSGDDVPVLRQVTGDLLSAGINGARGGFGIASLRPGDPGAEIAVANRVAPELLFFKLQDAAVQAAECASGFCHGGVCSECGEDEDCPGAQTCEWQTGQERFGCQGGDATLGSGCQSSAECASGFCEVGVCGGCADEDDCRGEQVCGVDQQLGYAVCQGGALALGSGCESGMDCESGVCADGRCSECEADEDCGGMLRCRRRTATEGGWYHACQGGGGAAGSSCFDQPRSPADLEPFLVESDRRFLSAPSGPVEPLTTGDMRGIAADPDRDRLYALSRVPPGLAIMETETGESGEEKQVVAFVDLCVQPSNLQLHRSESGWLLAYVVCWASGQLYVVDPRAAELVSIIPVGKGPHDIAFAPDDPWIPSYLRNKAYVSNFAENTISIIDLDVQSPTWHQVIGRIGLPEQAVKQ
jgi:hypothetical protein